MTSAQPEFSRTSGETNTTPDVCRTLERHLRPRSLRPSPTHAAPSRVSRAARMTGPRLVGHTSAAEGGAASRTFRGVDCARAAKAARGARPTHMPARPPCGRRPGRRRGAARTPRPGLRCAPAQTLHPEPPGGRSSLRRVASAGRVAPTAPCAPPPIRHTATWELHTPRRGQVCTTVTPHLSMAGEL